MALARESTLIWGSLLSEERVLLLVVRGFGGCGDVLVESGEGRRGGCENGEGDGWAVRVAEADRRAGIRGSFIVGFPCGDKRLIEVAVSSDKFEPASDARRDIGILLLAWTIGDDSLDPSKPRRLVALRGAGTSGAPLLVGT